MIKNFLSTLLLLFSISVYSQVTNQGIPASWNLNLDDNVKTVNLPGFDLEAIQAEDAVNDYKFEAPWRFGYMHSVDYGFDNGTWTVLENGDRIWRLLVKSKKALSLNFVFDDFFMPEGGKVYLYNNNKTDLLGAYDSTQNQDSGVLGTWLVQGDAVWIEYYEPISVKGQGRLHIAKATHGYRNADTFKDAKGLNDSGACNLDVDCSIGEDWEELKEHNKRSAGILLSGGSGFCSGALINNTANDGTPYFLTANHCFSNPSSWAFRFGWISPNPVCASNTPSTDGPTNMTISGATEIARDAGSDFALVEINQAIPEDWDRVFAGWDRSDITPDFTVGIHHPSGDIMKVCRDNDQPTQTINGGAQTWEITTAGGGWEIGVTEPGSSGSPLFDAEGRIIGQLYGGGAACSGTVDNDLLDYYGRLGVSWEGGGSPSSRLRDWLDPTGSGATDSSAYPALVSYPYDIGVESIDSPLSGTLSNAETVTVSITNYGENEASNFEVSYQVDGGSVVTETYTGTVASTETVQHTFSTPADMSEVGTTYSITAYTTFTEDEDAENDSLTVDVTHLDPNDIGVSEVISPSSGELLSAAEAVTVTVTNYGGATQYDFDVTYEFNGETVTEVVAGPLEGNSSIEYTFNQTVDISAFGSYTITVYTSLDGDSGPSNDSISADITNINCAPSMDCSFADGFQLFQFADINNESGCEGYGDFTDQSTDVELGETYGVTMTTGYGDQFVRIWIDYNDDFNFTLDELVLDNYEMADGAAGGSYTETVSVTIPITATLGEHLMRAKTNWQAGVPDDACELTTYGETEDYMINIQPGAAYDIGVTNITNPITGTLTASETITVEIFNFGENEVSNFEVSYSVNGGDSVTETFTGTIASGESSEYSFTTTADMSTVEAMYTIVATVSLTEDEDAENDSYEVEVEHLIAFDTGVTAMISPTSGILLSSAEVVTVEITNFGGATLTDFEITYEVDGESVTETVPGPLEGNSTMEYTFTQTVDLSIPGSYSFTCYTSLTGDDVPSNDSANVDVVNSNCAPSMNCGVGDGLQLFQMLDINNPSGCEGYGDFTDLVTNVEQGGIHDVTMTTGYGNQYVKIWIDMNDDYNYTADEIVLDNYILGEGSAGGTYTETTQVTIPADAPLGMHSMRVKTNWNAGVPDDACELTTYGETEDYMVNVVTSLGIGETELTNSEFVIYSNDNENFTVKLTTDYSDLITFSVYDVSGRLITNNNISKANNTSFVYNLNMSEFESGIYFVRMGNSTIGYKTGRIVVK